MTTQDLNNRLNEIAKELLEIPEIATEYKSKETEAIAKDWLLGEALRALVYPHEERMEMAKTNK